MKLYGEEDDLAPILDLGNQQDLDTFAGLYQGVVGPQDVATSAYEQGAPVDLQKLWNDIYGASIPFPAIHAIDEFGRAVRQKDEYGRDTDKFVTDVSKYNEVIDALEARVGSLSRYGLDRDADYQLIDLGDQYESDIVISGGKVTKINKTTGAESAAYTPGIREDISAQMPGYDVLQQPTGQLSTVEQRVDPGYIIDPKTMQPYFQQPDGSLQAAPTPSVDDQISMHLVEGNMDAAVSKANFRDRPSSLEYFNAAMDWARTPADIFTISAIVRGVFEPTPGPMGELRRVGAPPAWATQAWVGLQNSMGIPTESMTMTPNGEPGSVNEMMVASSSGLVSNNFVSANSAPVTLDGKTVIQPETTNIAPDTTVQALDDSGNVVGSMTAEMATNQGFDFSGSDRFAAETGIESAIEEDDDIWDFPGRGEGGIPKLQRDFESVRDEFNAMFGGPNAWSLDNPTGTRFGNYYTPADEFLAGSGLAQNGATIQAMLDAMMDEMDDPEGDGQLDTNEVEVILDVEGNMVGDVDADGDDQGLDIQEGDSEEEILNTFENVIAPPLIDYGGFDPYADVATAPAYDDTDDWAPSGPVRSFEELLSESLNRDFQYGGDIGADMPEYEARGAPIYSEAKYGYDLDGNLIVTEPAQIIGYEPVPQKGQAELDVIAGRLPFEEALGSYGPASYGDREVDVWQPGVLGEKRQLPFQDTPDPRTFTVDAPAPNIVGWDEGLTSSALGERRNLPFTDSTEIPAVAASSPTFAEMDYLGGSMPSPLPGGTVNWQDQRSKGAAIKEYLQSQEEDEEEYYEEPFDYYEMEPEPEPTPEPYFVPEPVYAPETFEPAEVFEPPEDWGAPVPEDPDDYAGRWYDEGAKGTRTGDRFTLVGEEGPELALFPRGTEIVPLNRPARPKQRRRLRNNFADAIDSFAFGGFSSGGPALVGEMGPEVVDLPPGAQVMPAGITEMMTGRPTRRPRSLMRQAGMRAPSAQTISNLLPEEIEVYQEMGRLAGIPEKAFEREFRSMVPMGQGGTRQARFTPRGTGRTRYGSI